MYETSYAHREPVTQIVVTRCGAPLATRVQQAILTSHIISPRAKIHPGLLTLTLARARTHTRTRTYKAHTHAQSASICQ